MNNTHLKFAAFLIACLAVCISSWNRRVIAQSEKDEMTIRERRGKQIYLSGDSVEGPQIVASLGQGDIDVPASTFACANCHGITGEGTEEGGLQSPPIGWQALTTSQTSQLTRRERPPYREETIVRAIRSGLDSTGVPLHPGMPRFNMTDQQAADLIAFMKKLGREADPGISDSTIRIGAAVPLTGPLAKVGEDIRATLAAAFADANEQGGVYGRRIELVVEDSKGNVSGTDEATRRLVEQKDVFALVGSFESTGSNAANEYLKQHEVPLVGPVALSPHVSIPPNPFIFYLLPTFNEQARSLVDFIAARAEHQTTLPNVRHAGKSEGSRKARLAVVYLNSEMEKDGLAGLHEQSKKYPITISHEEKYEAGSFSAEKTVSVLSQNMPDYVFFFGSARDMSACFREMERVHLNIPLVSSVVMLGRDAFELSPAVAARVFLSYPSALPDQSNFVEFVDAMQRRSVEVRSPAFQTIGYAAAKTLVEAMKQSTRALTRKTLVNALEQLREFSTGVVPPLSFGPNKRVGVLGSFIVGIDMDHKTYVPLSGQLVPKD
jgi:ABC-type branched-subunit amino acid transport system substrate-binding protein